MDRNADVVAASEAIATRLKARGSLNVQLRIHDGAAVCLEINARFSGTTGMRARLGFNDVEFTLRHYLFNEPAHELPVIDAGIAARYFDELYPDALAGKSVPERGGKP